MSTQYNDKIPNRNKTIVIRGELTSLGSPDQTSKRRNEPNSTLSLANFASHGLSQGRIRLAPPGHMDLKTLDMQKLFLADLLAQQKAQKPEP